MGNFVLLAKPIWVNLLILAPIFLFAYWKKNKLSISKRTLFYTLLFRIAFGVIEASCVVYLRAATNLLPGYHGSIMDIWKQASVIYYNQEILQKQLPMSLLVVETVREIGTMVVLAMIGIIAANKTRERVAIFMWTFATWDIIYYAHLWLTVRWPQNLTTPDVLFLVPEPWFGQVWFPILVSGLTMLAVVLNLKKKS